MSKKKNSFQSTAKIGLIFLFLLLAIFYVWHQYDIRVNNGFQQAIIQTKPVDFQKFGIDISHHQESIDWEELLVKNEMDSLLSFVYFKVSEGINHSDSHWKVHRDNLIKHNKQFGAYHFFLPDRDAKLQAENFLKHYTFSKCDLPPVLDAEINDGTTEEFIKNITIWLDEVEKKTAKKPLIYTSLHLYETIFKNHFLKYKFWIASYSRIPNLEEDKRIICWQYSEKGRLPGIKGFVDLNVMRN